MAKATSLFDVFHTLQIRADNKKVLGDAVQFRQTPESKAGWALQPFFKRTAQCRIRSWCEQFRKRKHLTQQVFQAAAPALWASHSSGQFVDAPYRCATPLHFFAKPCIACNRYSIHSPRSRPGQGQWLHCSGLCTKKGRKARRREGDKWFFACFFFAVIIYHFLQSDHLCKSNIQT